MNDIPLRKVSVVVPVYYNEQSLPPLFAELLSIEKQLREQSLTLEMIFVDDGSGDNSLAELLKIKQQRPDVHVIKHSRNFGSMHALKSGFQFVTGDCFTILAADLQDPPELIPEMAERWLRGSKYVVCARESRKDSLHTRIFAAIYYKLLRIFVVRDYPTNGYDLALMDRIMLPYLQHSSKNINIALFAYWLGFRPEVISYHRRKRAYGKSRWTFSKKLKYFLDSLLGFSIVPIRLISLIGAVVSIASFAYGTFVVINGLLGLTEVRGFAALASLISFLLGLIISMLGVIGEYIWRIFDEINKRPEAVIEEVF